MKKFLIFFSIVLLFLSCSIGFAENQPARDLIASLAQLPGLSDSPDKGLYVDLVKAIDDVYPGKIKIEVYPFPRSIQNVIDGKADFHIPKLRNPLVSESKLPYQFISEKHGTVSFVIYSNKDKIITKKALEDAVAKGSQIPYQIDMVTGSESNFPFPGVSNASFEQSLQKVQNKRTDAIIWSQEESDLAVKNLKLNAIHREHYGDFDEVILVQKGPKGDELDKILSECLRKLKATGRLQELYNKIHTRYNDWQPTNMGW
ncbi:MAG TPA: transporter substrate-binding domain-containing protein [Bacillota bacterium]|nr:transporter substrate-binding domain-containing protein [Bacillota bacterium]